MKKNLKIIIPVLFIGIILLVSVVVWQNNQWVMKVNNQKISKTEYAFYQKMYPRLDEKALEKQIVEDKVQLQQAKDQEIETITDYKSLQLKMEKVNQENEEKIKNNQVVYGLKKYSETSFYRYVLSTTINELELITAKEVTDDMLDTYYEEHKSEFNEIDAKEFYRVTGEAETLERLAKEATSKEQLQESSEVTLEQVSLNESTLRDWIKYREEELLLVNDLAVGEWSDTFSNINSTWSYYCLTSKVGEVKSFDEMKDTITLALEKDCYQENLDNWIKKAEVKVK